MYTDNPSYVKVTRSVPDILNEWEKHYGVLCRWDKYFPYPSIKSISLPNAYTLFKNKSLMKYRPITSYAAHPYKRLFNAAARALNFILENCTANHFNLAKICNFKKVIFGFNDILKVHDYNFESVTGDLANMYTNLDHDSIRTAVRWVLFETEKCGLRDRRCVSVPVSKSDNSVRYGRSVTSDGSRINLTYDELLEIVCFDLNNSFFTVGNFVGKQTCGIPMGSPISPALAVIVCAYYENKIFKAVNDWGWSNTNTIMGTRYMDDVLAFVTHDGSDISRLRAKYLLEIIKDGYHDQMVLECEDTSVPFKFLSTTVTTVSGEPIYFKYFSKNLESISSRGLQDFLTFQHYGSISPPSQKISVVISALHRICMNSASVSDFDVAVSDIFEELSLLKYPKTILYKALSRVKLHSRYSMLSSN